MGAIPGGLRGLTKRSTTVLGSLKLLYPLGLRRAPLSGLHWADQGGCCDSWTAFLTFLPVGDEASQPHPLG